MTTHEIALIVNGQRRQVSLAANVTLLEALREHLHCLDVKCGCEKGDCGACTVLLNGKAVNSCLVLAWQADGQDITTLAGLGTPERPHPLQRAFADLGATQCGFCTPGMIVAAAWLLRENPQPSREEIREALSGNLCRCTGYKKPVEAIERAAKELAVRGGKG